MGVKAWITVNGNHIPIMDGESKIQAVGRFIKDRNKKILKNRDKDFYKSVKQHQKENKNAEEDYKKSDSYNYWRANQDMEVKYGPNWDKQSKHNIKGRYKTAEELDNLRKDYKERSKDNWYSDTDRKHFAEKARQIAKKEVNNYDTKSYKLKEDRIKKTPVSSINVDTTSFRGTHGKEPGSLRVGGSSRGNWAFKLGNETVFINDTYSNAKKQALKEASRRGLWSIKVLG